jgi:hypothetical protein
VLNKIIGWRKPALFAGVIALIVGIVLLPGSEVKCGGRTMQEGDVCETTSNGSTISRSYSEQKSSDQQSAYLTLGFGALALLVGGAGFALNSRPGPRQP